MAGAGVRGSCPLTQTSVEENVKSASIGAHALGMADANGLFSASYNRRPEP